MEPAETMRGLSTRFSVVGTYLPVSGVVVTAPDDPRAHCDTPTVYTATQVALTCTLYKPGSQSMEVRVGATLLATTTVNVTTNVADVNWAAPSTDNVYGKDTVHFGETVTFKVSGSSLTTDPHMDLVVQQCNPSDTETGTSTDTERTFSCVFSGTEAGEMAGVLKDVPEGHTVYSLRVPVVTAPPKRPDTGITAAQCYTAGSNTLTNCASVAAMVLNDKQDGMVGRDVTSPGNTDGKLGFSYSTVGSYSKEECVKDNITGLTWEGKPTTGLRAAGNTYTHLGDNSANDASTYVAAVNAAALCGYSDWRLPTADELQGIVDYGVAYPGPTIDGTWFPNTPQRVYWSSTPDAGNAGYAWGILFSVGLVSGFNRDYVYHVRLVR